MSFFNRALKAGSGSFAEMDNHVMPRLALSGLMGLMGGAFGGGGLIGGALAGMGTASLIGGISKHGVPIMSDIIQHNYPNAHAKMSQYLSPAMDTMRDFGLDRRHAMLAGAGLAGFSRDAERENKRKSRGFNAHRGSRVT